MCNYSLIHNYLIFMLGRAICFKFLFVCVGIYACDSVLWCVTVFCACNSSSQFLLVNKVLIVCSCVCVCRSISVNSWRSRDSQKDFRDSCSRSTHTSSHYSSSSSKTRNHRCTTTARTRRTTNQPGLERYTCNLLRDSSSLNWTVRT